MHQQKLANLGSIVRELEKAVPHLLQRTMPAHLVHPNITFELLPETHMLRVSGSTAYKTIQKMIQLGAIPWLIPTGSKLDILSIRLTQQEVIEDRRLWLHWRSVLPTQQEQLAQKREKPFADLSLEPGRLIESLGLLPNEYPVLAGSFEFGFGKDCETIILHILRNIEYMAKPDSQLICT